MDRSEAHLPSISSRQPERITIRSSVEGLNSALPRPENFTAFRTGPSRPWDFVNQLSSAVRNRYVTFGHAFAYGHVPASKQLVAKVGPREILLQVDKKTTHGDGSLKFAVVTAKLDSLGGGQSIQSGLFTVSSAPVNAALNSKRRSSSF